MKSIKHGYLVHYGFGKMKWLAFHDKSNGSQGVQLFRNIARGTRDPEIDSVTWIKFSNNMEPASNMEPLAFVANLATRWRHLQ